MSRRPRGLTADERRLWAAVTRDVARLGRRRPAPEAEVSDVSGASKPGASKPEAPKPPGSPARPPAARAKPKAAPQTILPPPPPLAPLERRARTALRRGAARAEATLDLHGMRQAEAHAALVAFLGRARASGHGLVLVVTGKGGLGGDPGDPYAERGVLRRSVPLWLALPSLRGLVLGFEEAGPRQGGGGALYVRLRRAR